MVNPTVVIFASAIGSRKNDERKFRRFAFVAAFSLLTTLSAFGNTPPHTPVLIEPSESRAIDPGDVHMATAPFNDDDIDDHHACSDWEIRSADGHNVVWHRDCADGVLAVHIHLGDGAFVNAEGRLLGSTHYEVRVRFRDSSNDPPTEWSDWATRNFVTSPPSAILPLEITDVASLPQPRLYESGGSDLTLPAGASIAVGSQHGELLLSFAGANGANTTTNPSELADHAFVKVVIRSGADALSLPEANIDFADGTTNRHTICLPALALPPSASAAFWIAADGSSFEASAEGEVPDFSKLARSGLTPWVMQEPGYRIERVAGGLQLPVNIAFVPSPLPDGDAPLFYITELYGTIRVFLRDGTLRDYATGLLNFDPVGAFPGSGEQGIAGTAIDPETGDLFVASVYELMPAGPHYPKVIRIHSNDGGRTAATISNVFDLHTEVVGPSHQISHISIGPDGKLYVHIGDGFQTEMARSLDSIRGKILRMNKDGSPPADNPFYDESNGIGDAGDYIFAYGFRNPFGGAWRAADLSLYEVENGPDVDRLAKISAGFDYQWSGSNDDMLAHALYNWAPSVAPVNIDFVQAETFLGSGFPAEKHDHAFVSESGPTWVAGTTPDGKRIREFAFDDSGGILWTKSFLEYAGTGRATVAALAAGPDGLYFSDLYPDLAGPTDHGANVYRIRYVGRVTIGADIIDGTKTIRFSSTVTVPGYKNLEWVFGDGSTSTESNPEHTFSGNGPYDVTLRVTGTDGVTVEDYKHVQFPNVAGAGLTAIYSNAIGTTVARLDRNIDFNWQTDAPVPPAAFLNVTWTGEINPSVSALYTFDLRTEGEATLVINGHSVIDTRDHDQSAMTNPITLEAGQRYTFTLESEGNPLDGVTQLSWSAQGMAARIVPSSVFFPALDRRRAVGH